MTKLYFLLTFLTFLTFSLFHFADSIDYLAGNTPVAQYAQRNTKNARNCSFISKFPKKISGQGIGFSDRVAVSKY
jgi:hypothetical protein